MVELVRNPLEFDAPVVAVTVLEDRAHVVRSGAIELPAGMSRLRIREVAAVLSDKTLCGEVVALGGADDGARPRVSDVRARRVLVARDRERAPASAELHEQLSRVQDEQRRCRVALDRVARTLTGLERAASETLAEISTDLAWGATELERWREQLEELAARERACRERRLELEESQRERERELTRLRERVSVSATPRDQVAAELIVEVHTARPGRYRVKLDYIVPSACWRPHHRAELQLRGGGEGEGDEGERALRFVMRGCVWQNTGEDWRDVELTLSTERLSLGTEPPRLVDDVVSARRRSEQIDVEVRQQEVQTTGVGEGGASERVGDMPGIDDGGEVLALRVPGRVTVPSDGRPHRVELAEFSTPAACERVVTAELTPAALLKSTQTNRASRPILAGPVDLVLDGGFTGRAKVLFIAPGERFELGWGPDGAIRVKRDVDTSVEQARVLSSWKTSRKTVELRLSNLGAAPRRFTVIERIPVSEIEKVKIDVDVRKTSARRTADADGFVRWSVALAGHAREILTLVYTVKKHDDVSRIEI